MISVKISGLGFSKDTNIAQYTGDNTNSVGDVKFFFDGEDRNYDYWFVLDNIDKELQTNNVRTNGLFYFSAEHIHDEDYFIRDRNVKNFINQFSRIFSCYATDHKFSQYEIPFLPWMINHNHGTYNPFHKRDINFFKDLNSINKTKFLSVICSSKTLNSQQRLRINFLSKLKEELGDDLGWFGNGFSSIEDKWSAISDYKYHLVLENRINNNVISEKLFDSYLGLSIPLYSGAPNVMDFFPNDSLIEIDCKNVDGTLHLLDKLKGTNDYEDKMSSLLEAKNQILTKYNMWSRLAHIAIQYIGSVGEIRSQTISQLKSRAVLQVIKDFRMNLFR
jgi:hypothetical protein